MEHYFTNNANLKSDLREIKYKIDTYEFVFFSDNGVFSKNKVDFGTDLLIKTYLKDNKESKKILDVGCGYGVIGIVLSKITKSKVDMTDINNRSIHLTNMNIKKNKIDADVFISDAYENVHDKYDVIITNPPIRTGNKKVYEILNGAKKFLSPGGSLWFVVNKNQGALTIMKNLSNTYKIEIVEKNKSFYIFKAKC